MPGGYGRDESTPWGSSGTSYVSTKPQAPPGRDPGGSHRVPPRANTQSNQGNQHADEFGGTVTQDVKDAYVPFQSSTSNLPDKYTYSGDYKPGKTSRADQFASAFGGLDYDWADPDDSRTDFLTKDIWGNLLPNVKKDMFGNIIPGGPGNRLWDPFVKGYDPKTGKELKLSFDQWNTMLDYGEYDAGPIGNYSGWPGGGGGGGGDDDGDYDYGGGGGGGGGGYPPPERPQFPGQPGERWGQPNPLQQMMISLHGGQGFQQGFRRGGIVSLVE